MNRSQKILLFTILIIVGILVLSTTITDVINGNTLYIGITNKYVTYDSFLGKLNSDKITKAMIDSDNNFVAFVTDKNIKTTKDSITKLYDNSDYYFTQVPNIDYIKNLLITKNIVVDNIKIKTSSTSYKSQKTFTYIFFTLLFVLLIFPVLISRRGESPIPITSSSSDGVTQIIGNINTRFTDVIGHDEILDDIKFITKMLKNPEKGKALGAKVPKGILLSGPPGTGKTLIAKAIAGESDVNFITTNASRFTEMYVGVGPKRIHELFQTARRNSPCVLFIDELDAVGGQRSNLDNSEDHKTINALLQEMDGFKDRESVFIIAATNNAESLDKALVRSGRFDRQIVVNIPKDWTVREKLFNYYAKNLKLDESVDLTELSHQTSGFTGADISTLCNEAAIIAVMNDKKTIDRECFEEAIDKKVFKGNRTKEQKINTDKKIVAYHESGHAVATYLMGKPIARASIIGTTSGVGGAVFQQDNDSQFYTNEDLESQVIIAYAGRASEQIRFGKVTTGASNDITQATSIMINYIGSYGFDSDVGLLDVNVMHQNSIINKEFFSDRLKKMSVDLYNKTLTLLEENYTLVEKLATALLLNETMSGDEITRLFKG